MANLVAQGTSDQGAKGLTLRGKVESVQVKEIDRSSALIEIKLTMELVNVGAKPIILLQREPVFPGGALASKYTSSRKKESLATIEKLSPVWLRVVCEVWPWNVEPLNAERNQLKFGHKLRECWKDTGVLWLDEIYSEPIMIDMKLATLGGAP